MDLLFSLKLDFCKKESHFFSENALNLNSKPPSSSSLAAAVSIIA